MKDARKHRRDLFRRCRSEPLARLVQVAQELEIVDGLLSPLVYHAREIKERLEIGRLGGLEGRNDRLDPRPL
eukprot:scaffold23830_cov28-Tisochrysis_lutea.AAC.3